MTTLRLHRAGFRPIQRRNGVKRMLDFGLSQPAAVCRSSAADGPKPDSPCRLVLHGGAPYDYATTTPAGGAR